MSRAKKVIRFEPLGPADTGMPAMDLDQADFQSALPEQQLHVYFDDEKLGLNAGVWTTTDMQEAFGPYPGDEFMWVIEGQLDHEIDLRIPGVLTDDPSIAPGS